jgi:hypothetical protein
MKTTTSTTEQNHTSDSVEPKKSKDKASKILLSLIILVLIAALFLFVKAKFTKDPNLENQKQIEETVAKVGKLIALPEDETPTLAVVNDPAVLTNQAFFAHAKAGDVVLLYTAAQKVFLYNPQANIIVEVASLNLGQKK